MSNSFILESRIHTKPMYDIKRLILIFPFAVFIFFITFLIEGVYNRNLVLYQPNKKLSFLNIFLKISFRRI